MKIAFRTLLHAFPVLVICGDLPKPHPDAVANTHAPGEVDKPELIPFIVQDAGDLDGVVVDETSATLVGEWQYSTHTPPYVGIGYLHDRKEGKGEKSVTFTPISPKTASTRSDSRIVTMSGGRPVLR